MATYSIVTTALALGTPRKRVENLLVRGLVPGIVRGRQGASRRLTRDTVILLAAIVRLQDQLGIPAGVAASLLPDAPAGTRVLRFGPVTVSIDFVELAAAVSAALLTALEMAPRPRRGRPRRK